MKELLNLFEKYSIQNYQNNIVITPHGDWRRMKEMVK